MNFTRFNTTSANYGATSSSTSQPPPYAPVLPSEPSTWSMNVGPSSPSLISKVLNTRAFVAIVTFIVIIGICVSTIPMRYCEDPVDPNVRERIRGEWASEVLEHEKQLVDREIMKMRWAWEEEEHAVLLHQWERERVNHERELKERAQREEEERMRLNLSWGRVEAHQCKTYGTREYTAVLMNMPVDWKWGVQACKATPLEVHGIPRFPKSCENKGRGVVIGLWEIDQYEPDCNTFWNWYKDKGCTSNGSGKRRIEHYLENLPKGGDWREFCATTPARFHGLEFSGAHECFQYNLGIYGYWEIDDSGC